MYTVISQIQNTPQKQGNQQPSLEPRQKHDLTPPPGHSHLPAMGLQPQPLLLRRISNTGRRVWLLIIWHIWWCVRRCLEKASRVKQTADIRPPKPDPTTQAGAGWEGGWPKESGQCAARQWGAQLSPLTADLDHGHSGPGFLSSDGCFKHKSMETMPTEWCLSDTKSVQRKT